MIELEKIIGSIIRAVKKNRRFDDVRFIKAYKTETAEKPVSGYLAVAEIQSLEREKEFFSQLFGGDSPSYALKITFNIRLLAGDDISGTQLCAKAFELMNELKAVDSSKLIENVTATETKFDKQLLAFYRDIRAELSCIVSHCGVI